MFEYQNLKGYTYFDFFNILKTWVPSCGYVKVHKKISNDLVNI
jgi:hypothetical protein